MNDIDKELLTHLQDDFPVTPHPFEAIGFGLNLSESEVLAHVRRLLETGVIRRFGASLNPAAVGYVSTLAAAKAGCGRIDEAAAFINHYPQVTHNYEREDRFNIWFTVIARNPDEIRRILDEIRACPAVEQVADFPATRLFKVDGRFRITHPGQQESRSLPRVKWKGRVFTGKDDVIRALQEGLTVCEQPYAELADKTGHTETEIIDKIMGYLESGILRRLGAFVQHRKLGFDANGMCVFVIPENHAEELGARLAEKPFVSHCYTRKPVAEWPFNLYAMMHGDSREFVLNEAETFAKQEGIQHYRVLFSTREFKKPGIRLLLEDKP